MRLIFITLVCAFVAFAATGAQAGATGLLTIDRTTINHLEDDDWEVLIDNGTAAGTVDVNDYLVGMFEIQRVRDVHPVTSLFRSPAGATFTGIFVLKVATKVPSTIFVGGYDFGFAPATAAEWSALGLGLPTPSTGTIGLVYDDSSTPFVNQAPGGPVPPASLAGALSTATDGTLLWEVGFRGGREAAEEFWTGSSTTDAIASIPTSPVGLQFAASLNTTAYAPGAPLLLDHDFVFRGADGVGGVLGVFSEWQLTGAIESPGPGDTTFFDIKTDTDLYIKPAPEPGSLALLGLGLAAIGGVVVRRRRKS